MDNRVDALFSSDAGACAYRTVLDTIREYGMDRLIKDGVLLALSGGADSVFLACFLYEYRKRTRVGFSVRAVHVNHGIRAREADRDEEFSRTLSSALGFDFEAVHCDVPNLASERCKGVEETAREVRYSAFADIICGRNDLSCIATAHNATDNAETVIFNIARGSGAKGGSGIAPVRENIVRPLIALTKGRIVDLLHSCNIEYVTDSTNFSTDYTRNYIRHEILPRLEKINPRYAEAFYGFSLALREDSEYIDSVLESELDAADCAVLSRSCLLSLKRSAFARIIARFALRNGAASLERRHIYDLYELIQHDNFRYSLPGDVEFVCERGACRVLGRDNMAKTSEILCPLGMGDNVIPGFSGIVSITEQRKKTSLNVYKIFIQAELPSAIIDSGLYVRFKRDGDAYRYGGMTHKLKKVFNDRGIPPSHRELIPIVCDGKGILWVPGLGVREDAVTKGDKKAYISFLVPYNSEDKELYAAFTET